MERDGADRVPVFHPTGLPEIMSRRPDGTDNTASRAAVDLANRSDVDRYLVKAREDYDAKRRAARDADPTFYQKLADARRVSPGWLGRAAC